MIHRIAAVVSLMFFGCGTHCAPSSLPATLPSLNEFVDKVPKTEEVEVIYRSYHKATGDLLDDIYGMPEGVPIHTFRSGDARFAIGNNPTLKTRPGVSFAIIEIFDEKWMRLGKNTVCGGLDRTPVQSKIEYSEIVKSDLFVWKLGPPSETQYIGFDKNEFHFIRWIDASGNRRRRMFGHGNYRGVPIPKLTKEQWIERLQSKSIIERLGALDWILGEHMPSSEKRPATESYESLEHSQMFESVRDDPRTRAIIAKIKSDTNPWVRECADLWTWGK